MEVKFTAELKILVVAVNERLTFASPVGEIAGGASRKLLQYDAYQIFLLTKDAALCMRHIPGL